MIGSNEPASAADGKRLRSVAAAFAFLMLILVAVCGLIANLASRGMFPQLPLSGIIGPARTAELRFAQLRAKGDVSPSLAQAARRAAAHDPLAYEPFLFAAATEFRDSRSTGTPKVVPLLNETLRRNPRSRAGRVMLLRRAVGAGDLGQAIDELAMLNLLNADVAVPVLRKIGRDATTVAMVSEAASALAAHPELYDDYVSGFVATPKPTAVVVSLARSLPAAALEQPRVRDALVARLVQDGNFLQARAVATHEASPSAGATLDDPGFARPKSIPPFGWSFTQSAIGVAERSGPGSVLIDYYGRTSGPLLEQLATLVPGAYSLEIGYALQSAAPGTIVLEVRCANSTLPALLSRRIAEPAMAGGTATIPFVVPAQSCSAQSVALVGLPNDRRTAQQLTVSRIDVKRAARQ